MATTGIGAPGTLSSALAPRKSNLVPVLLLLVGLVAALGAAAYGYIETQRTEKVVILARPVPYGQQIVAEDLATIELPLHRPVQMAGMTNPASIIGTWAARDMGVNDLVKPDMLLAQAPDHPVYPNGRELHADMVPIPFATATIGPITDRDLVNLGFTASDPGLCNQVGGTVAQTPAGLLIAMETAPAAAIQSGSLAPSAAAPAAADPAAPQAGQVLRSYACRFMQRVPILYIEEGTAYLEVTPYQAHAIWALQASGTTLWGERYGASSRDLPPMTKLDASQITLDRLTAPVTDTTTVAAPPASAAIPGTAEAAVPGDGAAIPGSGTEIPGSRADIPGAAGLEYAIAREPDVALGAAYRMDLPLPADAAALCADAAGAYDAAGARCTLAGVTVVRLDDRQAYLGLTEAQQAVVEAALLTPGTAIDVRQAPVDGAEAPAATPDGADE